MKTAYTLAKFFLNWGTLIFLSSLCIAIIAISGWSTSITFVPVSKTGDFDAQDRIYVETSPGCKSCFLKRLSFLIILFPNYRSATAASGRGPTRKP